MAPKWEMREQLDQQAVSAIATAICKLPEASLPTEPPIWSELRVSGTSFRARLLLGPGRDDARLQMWVYFARPTGPWPQTRDSWSALVRCDGGGNRPDRFNGRLAKSLRRRFAPGKTRALETDGMRVPSFLKTAHWWVRVDGVNQNEDLQAQIWLFLLQADLLQPSAQGLALAWCWDYLQRRFPVEGKVEGKPVADTVLASDVLEKLVNNHWRPPSVRAWSSYVHGWVYHSPKGVERRRAIRDPAPEDQAIASRDGLPPDEKPARSSGSSQTCTVSGENEAEAFTVDQAARILNIPQRTLYDWIGAGRLRTTDLGQKHRRGFAPMLISRSELERAKAERRPKPGLLILLRQQATDSSYEAARKWVRYQQQRGLSVEQIVELIPGGTERHKLFLTQGKSLPRIARAGRSFATPAPRPKSKQLVARSRRRKKGFPRLSGSGEKIECGWGPVPRSQAD